jgi:deazaflavin-dependent oxidoreductase (nitroreductase family)
MTMAADSLRKFRFERRVGRVLNPVVSRLERLGVRATMSVELETIGAKSGLARRVPLVGSADDVGVWVISQHGRRAGWAHNIAAHPRVRVRVDGRWHNGAAEFVPDDDVVARARSFGGQSAVMQSATAAAIRAMQSDPISVRITFTD